VAKSRRQSGDKTKIVENTSKVTRGKSVRKDDPANSVPSSSSDASASGSNWTSSDDDNPNATDMSSSDDGYGPLGPPSPPSGYLPSDSSRESDATARKRSATPTKQKELLVNDDRIKKIRPANSRFKTLLDCRTYFLIRRQLTYTPKEAQRSHRLNKRLEGACHGQQPFTRACLPSLGRHPQAAPAAHDDPPNGYRSRLRETGPEDDDGTIVQTGSHPAAPSDRRPASQSG